MATSNLSHEKWNELHEKVENEKVENEKENDEDNKR